VGSPKINLRINNSVGRSLKNKRHDTMVSFEF